MREIELKAVVDSREARCQQVARAGGTLVFHGRLEDRRFDTQSRELAAQDTVLRLRVYRDEEGARAELGWKGRTTYEGGYKVREEIAANSPDASALAELLGRLGYIVTRVIEREITQYSLDGAVVRFESYPRMDDLVEVEGTPAAIERAIAVLGVPRDAFSNERLPAFVARYEARTGERAALCDAELTGDMGYHVDDA